MCQACVLAVPYGAPLQLETAGDSASVNATWQPPATYLQNGAIEAYAVQYKVLHNSQELATACNGTNFATVSVVGSTLVWMTTRAGGYGYSIRVAAQTLAGVGPYSNCSIVPIVVEKPGSSSSIGVGVGAGVASGVAVIVAVVIVGLVLYRRKMRRKVRSLIYRPETLAQLDRLRPLEVDRECVSILHELGEGQFGKVFEASATGLPSNRGKTLTVAVKFLNDEHQDVQGMFIEEAARMSALKHPQVVQLLAVCFESAPFFIVLEHMSNGDLKSFLFKNRNTFIGSRRKIDVQVMVGMCREVASAMVFLAKAKYVHRDIAARNVLVDGDEHLKIGDFGLSRSVYTHEYYRKQGGGVLPLRSLTHPID